MKEEATFLTVKNKSSQQEFKINTEDILYAMKTEEFSLLLGDIRDDFVARAHEPVRPRD